jgi:hypothetical protein
MNNAMTKRKIKQYVSTVLGLMALSLLTFISLTGKPVKHGLINHGISVQLNNDEDKKLMGNRFLTFASVVRVNQIEVSRRD